MIDPRNLLTGRQVNPSPVSGGPGEDCGPGESPSGPFLAGATYRTAVIAEQWIDDPVSGLRIGIQIYDDADIGLKIIFIKAGGEILPYGNREIFFDTNGKECGGGTYTGNVCAVQGATR